jgi:protein-disulfide isomerase
MAQGAEDAPVTVIEYGSFTCPHCAAWHEESYEQLKEEFIDTGRCASSSARSISTARASGPP